jgi:hypothetical protein
MPERGYFSQRWAIPGYTFILLIVAINFVPLNKMLKLTELTSVFGGFLALLSGSVIGFLISQSWWWWFHSKFKQYEWSPIRILIDKYKLTKESKPKDKKNVLIVYDYVLFSGVHSDQKKKGISTYLFRRWDMYILLSCTKLSLILGVAAGVLFRILSEYFLFQMSFLKELEQNFLFFLHQIEFWFLAIILVAAIILVIFVWHGQAWIRFEYERMHDDVIKESDIKQEKLKEIFPPDYFDKKTSEQTNQTLSKGST